MRKKNVVKALIFGVLLALAVPGVAFANTMSVTVQTPGATRSNPRADVDVLRDRNRCRLFQRCPHLGRRVNQAIGTGGLQWQPRDGHGAELGWKH